MGFFARFLFIFSFFFLGASPVVLGASCYSKLLKNHTVDSSPFQVFLEEVADLFESDPPQASLVAIGSLVKSLGCEDGELGVLIPHCRKILERAAASQVCYVQSDEGHFFVMVDEMRNFNILFNRYD